MIWYSIDAKEFNTDAIIKSKRNTDSAAVFPLTNVVRSCVHMNRDRLRVGCGRHQLFIRSFLAKEIVVLQNDIMSSLQYVY